MSEEDQSLTPALKYNKNSRPDIGKALKDGVRVIPVEVEDQMKEAYLGYAMSVIVGRALPDVRDGLKPVHRRILHAMNERAWRSDRPYVKCAKIVGEVIGNYHPHGDSAVYDALVRMVQDFSLRVPLIDGQGNFGSIDGDSPAAYRYTEARLEKVAEELLRDIEKETVSFSPNFDDTRSQPDVLPANFPNLLVNGSSGIAVGMATNIPPHNLSESINAVIEVTRNPDVTIPELMKIMPGPDFPTSGIIIAGDGLYNAYTTGKGSIMIRSKVDIEENKKGREIIVITELPYQVNKKVLLEKIGDLVNERIIEGISEILDLSDRHGIRVELVLKKDSNAQVILNQLYKLTQLQVSYGITLLAILNNKPKIFNLKEILQSYSEHRRQVIVKRTEFDLDKAEKRAHILEGLKIALENIEDVIKVIRASKNPEEAKSELMKRFSLSQVQAEAILEMRLQRLTSLEVQKVIDELNEVRNLIKDLKDILEKPSRVIDIVCTELREVSEKFGTNRKTEINLSEVKRSDFDALELIANEEVVIQITHDQFIKRLPVDTFKNQRRGGKGIQGTSAKREDIVKIMNISMTHDFIMIFSNIGRVYLMKVHEVPQGSKESRGKSLKAIINLKSEEIITSFFTFKEFSDDLNLLMVTKNGFIKKTNLSDFSNTKKSGIIALGIRDNDELISAKLVKGDIDIMIASAEGLAIRTNLNNFRTQGRTASGVTGMKLRSTDRIVGVNLVDEAKDIIVISEMGFGKRMSFDEFLTKGRAGKGMTYLKVAEKNGRAIGIDAVHEEDELIIITKQGKTIRVNVKDISKVGRTAMGVKIVDVTEEDKVQDFAIIDGK